LLARTLRANDASLKTTVVPYGWPDDPKVLDTADCIVVYADGSDHNRLDHPLLHPGRMDILNQQMQRGCGLVTLHYATFAPLGADGDRYLDWVGGHFDYESGPGANHWASAIDNWLASVSLPSPQHPIMRGVRPYKVQEEFYTQLRFRKNDPRRVDLLQTVRPQGGSAQTVGWAVTRTNGGRGFGYTGGHALSTYKDANIRKMLCNAILWTAKQSIPMSGVATESTPTDDPIRVTVLTGHHHPAHDWKATTAALHHVTASDKRLELEVVYDPELLAGDVLETTDVLLINYCNWESATLSADARGKLSKYVRGGGGLFLLHFANGAWRDWLDYHGGFSRRVWVDGKANHDAYGTFSVDVMQADHVLTRGLHRFTTTDELYCSQVGTEPVSPLLTAISKVTGKAEPLAYTYKAGRGVIVQTLLGHDAGAVLTPEHAEFIRRGLAFAAGREVLQFPLERFQGKAVSVPGLNGMAADVTRGALRLSPNADIAKFPVRVSVRAMLTQSKAYNILIAHGLKSSRSHWEVFSEADSGRIAVYVPGSSPSLFVSDAVVTDGKWHDIDVTISETRVGITVDGVAILDKACSRPDFVPESGELWIGGYPPDGLTCTGSIDELQVWSASKATLPVVSCTFDSVQENGFDASNGLRLLTLSRDLSLKGNIKVKTTVKNHGIPVIDKSTTVDWRGIGNDSGGMRYSQLGQINKANVNRLKTVWEFTVDDASDKSTLECTPIVVDGVMYLTSVNQKVIALQAATGKTIWQFDPATGGVNRGVAYWSDSKSKGKRRILFGTGNGRLWSIDALTGKPDPMFGKGGFINLKDGYERDLSGVNLSVTSAVAIYQNIVIVPVVNSEGQPGAPGDIRAFDVRTGREAWRFHTVPKPYEAGSETWLNDGWKNRSGANPWSGFTVDAARGIVFCGVGSAASDFYGGDRPGNNLFANSTLALDARNGKRLWHFQTVHHDVWDHDNPCPPLVVNVESQGKRIDAVAQPTKTGFIYVFDRVTGRSLFPIVEKPAPKSTVPGEWTAATQPVPLAPPALSRSGFTDVDVTNRTPDATASVRKQLTSLLYGKEHLPPSVQGTVVAPGFHGGATWSGASFDPETGYLYINTNDIPSVMGLTANSRGGYDFNGYQWFNDHEGYPGIKPPWGWL
ncbi:MAG: ThuA domain-containing protein, partial [Armatimonadota bacterium]